MSHPLEALRIVFAMSPKGPDGSRKVYGWITVKYSRGGTAIAYYNYLEKPLGRAGGYGYDKSGVALANCLERLFEIDLPDGSIGWDAIINAANKKKGVRVIELRDLPPKY